jgi:hypothetical protein
MTQRLTIGLVAIALFVLVVMVPVSAVKVTTGPTYYYNVSQYINQGATVFIGEDHLNFTNTGLQINDVVGYWPPGADRTTTPPIKTVMILNVTDVTITYSEFGGFGSISDWYYVYPNYTGGVLIGRVADPGLDVAIFAPRIATDVSDKAVFRGEDLQLGIANNLYPALTTNRTPVYNTSTGDGYIDLFVQNPSGAIMNKLYTDQVASPANKTTLWSINVTTSPYIWGQSPLDAAADGSAGVPPFSWHTNASNNSQHMYEPGAYSVWAESQLNNMKSNYLNGGAAYSGKTVSQIKTITIVTKRVKVGVFRPGGTWYLDRNDNGIWEGMPTDRTFSWGKQPGDIPITGDWNGNNITETGIFRPGGNWFLDMNNNGMYDNTPTDRTFSWGKQPGDIPITGDWNNDGFTETGIFRRGAGFYLDMNNNGVWDSPPDNMLAWGLGLYDIPVTGDWNVDNITETGVFRNGDWYLDMNNNGHWDQGTDMIYPLGQPGDRPVTGNWL